MVNRMEGVFDLASAIRRGDRSATDVVGDAFDRIDKLDGNLNAFLYRDRRRALERAAAIDTGRARGDELAALAGVPIAIKDNICTTQGTTTCASKILAGYASVYNAHVVDRLEAAGAIIIGKTNLDEFAMGSSTENSAYGATRNPWNLSRVPGGSSGGSAAAVAARLVPAALGSDTGGSIRQPASFCGVVRLKPSYGRVSRYGLVAFGSSLDQIGPITRDVRDAALVLGVIAGHDARDSTSIDAPVPDYVEALDRPLKGINIGISDEFFAEGLDDHVRRAVRAAIDVMAAQGATVTSVDLPHLKYAVSCYYLVAPAEASSNLARFDGVHYGHRTEEPSDVIDMYRASRGEGFGLEVKRRIMLGTYALSSGYHDAYYVKALKVRTLIKRDFDEAFRTVDVIASPVAPTTAFEIGAHVDDPLAMYLCDTYTLSANLAGICGISVPCGFDDTGLPIGLQLLAPALHEETVLAAAHQYQLVSDHHTRAPADP